MAWTSPSTVVAGQLMTAAFWNTQVRDNFLYLYGLQQGLALPYSFGGLSTFAITVSAYPVGSTLNVLAANTGMVVIDNAALPAGTYKLEAMLSNSAGGVTTLGLFNLTDAPSTAIVEITSNVANGERKQSSSITFGTAAKTYGLKAKVTTGNGFVWGARIVRTT